MNAWMAAGAVVVAIAAMPVNGHATRKSAGCAWGEVKVRAGGVARCLRDGGACSARLAAAYRRAGFACRHGFLEFDWSTLRRRPVGVQRLEPASGCPVASRTGSIAGYPHQPAWGPGPAWPFVTGETERPRVTILPVEGHDWGTHKVMWAIDPRYVGPILVRGAQLDGANEVRFENGRPAFTEEQRLHPAPELRLEGGYIHPAVTRLREPGCYAWQIDGIGFSRRIVFEAVPV